MPLLPRPYRERGLVTIGWGCIRVQKFTDLEGICEYCGLPITKISQSCLHHKVNRKQGGKYTYENAELRHKECEKEAHAKYPFGNKEGNLKGGRDVPRKRRNLRHAKGKGKRPSMPRVRGEGPSATFRKVRKDRPVYSMPTEIPNRDHTGVLTLEERVERIERMLFPATR